ncbi:glycosyltransferase [candidate division WOR-3 bacterium]|nr:glycosyltransferase [candidate division WOR-3 bacterium]
MLQLGKNHIKRMAVIGNYLPRQCGIATFTTDLCEAIACEHKKVSCFAVAVNDTETGYTYPPRVRFEVTEGDVVSYRRTADFLNINNVDVISLQHEYGIYGGLAGSHILALLRELRMPLVTTLHTVLREPDSNQRKVMEELIRLSDRMVVMSEHASQFMHEVYDAPLEKIEIIPHGIPDIAFVDPNFYKDQFGVEGKMVILTFGLISPSKGIENVIKALPRILERYPNIVYIVVGATHPNVLKHEGESYRLSLEILAKEHGVEKAIIFHNRFVSIEELIEFISATDIYVTPYINQAQIVSGTLAYVVGAGKPVISTPYWYAEELLADNRGALVGFNEPEAIADQAIELLDNEVKRNAMRKRCYLYGREMIWPTVAQKYMRCFENAYEDRMRSQRGAFVTKTLSERPPDLPLLNLGHLFSMTDDTGMLQHAVSVVPNYKEGYTTDDNARALILTTMLEEITLDKMQKVDKLAIRYLAFLMYAFNSELGRFRNFLSYDRRWLEECGSEDSHGRSLWALGMVLGRSKSRELRDVAGRMFSIALPATLKFTSPRAWSFTLIGIHEYLRRFSGDRDAQSVEEVLAEKLMGLYRRNAAPDWQWFEDVLTYSNAKMSYALLLCAQRLERGDMKEVALATLEWLSKVQQSPEGFFEPVGCNGFYRRGEERALFDQQPIEAFGMILACLETYRITGENRWYKEAERAFEWFLGRNDGRLGLYDPTTGGCCDSLHSDRVSENQGAESTLAFLLSLVEMRQAEHVLTIPTQE